MSVSRLALVAMVLVGLGSSPGRSAEPVRNIFQAFSRDYSRNNCWPEPFLPADRRGVRTPFAIMVANGWKQQNTLDAAHFDVTGSRLTPEGQNKARWILLEAPRQFRAVFVQRSGSPHETAMRITAVHQLALKVLPPGAQPSIFETNASAPSWPAANISAVHQAFQDSTPQPRLSAAPVSTGGE